MFSLINFVVVILCNLCDVFLHDILSRAIYISLEAISQGILLTQRNFEKQVNMKNICIMFFMKVKFLFIESYL